MERGLDRVRRGEIVPGEEELLPLVGLDHRDRFEGGLGRAHHPLEERAEVAEQARDRRGVEAAALVRGAEDEGAAEDADDRQRVVRLLGGARVVDGEAARALTEGLFHRVVLEDHQRLEERRPAGHVAPALDLDQRRVLVLAQLGLLRLQRRQPVEDLGGGRRAHAHRKRVDEEPDHPVDAGHRRGSTGDGAAEEHVGLAAVAREQERPGRLHQRAEGELVLAREGLERGRRLVRERDLGLF